MKIDDTQELIESGSGENDDSNIRYYCKTEELFDVLEATHVNIGNKRTRGKRQCFVCDSQNIIYLFFLNFYFFFSFMEAERKKKFCNVTRQVIDFFLALCEQCHLKKKDTKRWISCTPNPFTLHEFLVPGRLD
jgi:hypothetical protein